jgi:snapalysin
VIRKRLSAALLGTILSLASVAVSAPAQAAPDDPDKIVGGRQVTQTYSFLVHVPGGCTGVLIHSRWVATAQHCPTPAEVRVGSSNRTSGGTVARVDAFSNLAGLDLKLLRLSSAVAQAPAIIPTRPPVVNNVVRVMGWGQSCPTPGCAGGQVTIARERDQTVAIESRCSEGFIDSTNEMCINSSACFGDSGGPVIDFPDPAANLVYGVISRGDADDCSLAHTIAVDLTQQRARISAIVGVLPT